MKPLNMSLEVPFCMEKRLGVFIWVLALVLAIMLSVYSYNKPTKNFHSFEFFLEEPEKYHGMMAENTGRIADIKEGSFYLSLGRKRIKVLYNGKVRPVKFGLASVVGRYNKEGYIEASQIRYHDYGNVKYLLSLPGLFVLAYFMLREWRITGRGLMPKCLTG
jgi:hypothetical protein